MKDASVDAAAPKYRSPLRALDLHVLRLLCDLHPWPLRVLSREAGMVPSVLSNVLAGQRPLPTRLAEKFLSLVGMRPDGTLDPNHVFVFVNKLGREGELEEVLKRVFTESHGVLHLSKADAQSLARGRALFDGRFMAVVHEAGLKDLSTVGHIKLHQASDEHALLSLNPLPTKLQFLKAFAGGEFARVVTWDEVRLVGEARGLAPVDVLDLIERDARKRAGE
jgi:hypothetical protein